MRLLKEDFTYLKSIQDRKFTIKIRHVFKQINSLELMKLKATKSNRSHDTNRKIQIGNGVIMAGLAELHDLNPAILIGALQECKDSLVLDSPNLERWKQLGLKALSDNKTT